MSKVFYNNNNYNLSPFVFLVKKYYLKNKKIKYKKYRRLFTNKIVYSKLYNHKLYSLTYHVNFEKKLDDMLKFENFHASQFYFYNFSGILKYYLVKDILLFNLKWRKLNIPVNDEDDDEKQKKDLINFIIYTNSYYYNTYNVNLRSKFLLSNNSKNYLTSYHTNIKTKLNNYYNNYLNLEQIEYNKTYNYYSVILNNRVYNLNNKLLIKLVLFNHNTSLSFFYKRWWGVLWGHNKQILDASFKKDTNRHEWYDGAIPNKKNQAVLNHKAFLDLKRTVKNI